MKYTNNYIIQNLKRLLFIFCLVPIIQITHYIFSLTTISELSLFILVFIWVSWLAAAILYIPKWLLSSKNYELNDLENKHRGTVVQILVAVVLLVGLYFTWQSLEVSKKNTQFTEQEALQSFKLAQQKEINNDFTRSVELLGNSNREVRLGGIYTLIWIAEHYSSEYYWPIAQTLAAYVREHSAVDYQAPHATPPTPDIQAIIAFIQKGPLNIGGLNDRIDLSYTDLSFSDFSYGILDDINFKGSILIGVSFNNASLRQANFTNCNLKNAKFIFSKLDNTSFINASLVNADFMDADLTFARFAGSNLSKANFIQANLGDADFRSYLNLTTEKFINKDATGLICEQMADLKSRLRTNFPKTIASCQYEITTIPMNVGYETIYKTLTPTKLYKKHNRFNTNQ